MSTSSQDLLGTIRSVIPPVHRAGWPFIAAFAVVAALLSLLAAPLGVVGLIATVWCIYFFRDPVRMTPERPGLIVSPADGMVVSTSSAVPPPELNLGDRPLPCVAIFLNVFDVHVNRVPAPGTIEVVAYKPGKFLNAAMDKASEDNERCGATLRLADGRALGFVQIAGLVARRIINELKEGQSVAAGERFGLIRFGSRVNLYLPDGVKPLVITGQRMVGGETVIADLVSGEPARTGTAR